MLQIIWKKKLLQLWVPPLLQLKSKLNIKYNASKKWEHNFYLKLMKGFLAFICKILLKYVGNKNQKLQESV